VATREEFEAQRAFEAEVRSVAEAIWGVNPGECQPAHYTNDPILHELDGLVRLPDVTHVVMATVSRKLDKTKDDVKKLQAAERIERQNGAPSVGKWFITRDQLEAEHVKHCQSNQVTALTLDQFRNRFFDARDYIAKRRNAAFGSARNISDNSISIPIDEYVRLPVRMIASHEGIADQVQERSLDDVEAEITGGGVAILVAPFGAGKSLTLREMFFRLSGRYLKSSSGRVPLAINLREHWGARYPDEVLERHARVIGFTPREHLVVAWRAGISILLLDGFDELGSQVIAPAADRAFMRAARLEALRAMSEMVAHSPRDTGIFIVGRDHYFDDLRELTHALGLTGRRFTVYELGEFGEAEAEIYLRKKGANGKLPAWLPRKPLILGYLSTNKLLPQILAIDGEKGFGYAWDQFLTKICEREAGHARSALDATTLRHLLERLAFDARCTPSGSGPITERDLAEAYIQETGQNPLESALAALQRLPGMTARDQDPGMRSFVDLDMLSALQGGCIARFLLQGNRTWSRSGVQGPLSRAAIAMAAHRLSDSGGTADVAIAAAKRISSQDLSSQVEIQIAGDCLEIALAMVKDEESIDLRGLELTGVYLANLPLEGMQINGLTLTGCVIDVVSLDERGAQSTLRLRDCDISQVQGAGAKEALPERIFQNCTVSSFDNFSTNAAIVKSDLPPSLKALLTILRKLYAQAGGGRKLAAFKRGLPPGPIQGAVEDVLKRVEAEGLMFVDRGIAHPIRSESARVLSILRAAALSDDPLVRQLSKP
jgi:hypothetical protein